MKSKLTLSIDANIIELGKRKARELNISLSQLLEQYLRDLTEQEKILEPSAFIRSIPAKKPTKPTDNLTDDEWLSQNLNI